MKSEFVSVASHQLRTPLTGIKWFSELMLRGKAGEVSVEQKDFLTQIHESNERMIKLVEDLLNVSRIKTGTKFEIVKKATDIVPIIDSLATDLVGLAAAHKVEIKKSADFPKSLTLSIDAEKIRQVFGNLMSNAVKYSPPAAVLLFLVPFSPSLTQASESPNPRSLACSRNSSAPTTCKPKKPTAQASASTSPKP